MDLKQVFSAISGKVNQKNDPKDQFLAIKISSQEVTSAVWSIEQEKVVVGEISQFPVKGSDFESLLSATDHSVATVPETVKQVIFGLPFHWVGEGKIIPEKLSLLRQLCTKLDLKPLGYVLLSEALENYYKEVEGAPLTAILLEFDGDQGQLSMYRAGKNLGSVPIKSNLEDLNSEIEKALKEFTQSEVLPSRIIIYDGRGTLEKISEKITAYPWTKNLPFLHFPKVEVFESRQVVRAVAVAGGMQMGGHFELVGEEEPKTQTIELPTKELEEVSALEAGFLPETEFAEMEIKNPSFGNFKEMETEPIPKKPNETLINLKNKLSKLLELIPRSLPKSPRGIYPLVGTIIAIIILILGLGLYYLPKANIILKVSSPVFDKELAVTVVTEKSTKPATDSAKTVTGTFIDVSEIGTKKGVASGRKLVGDKAHGSVAIYSASSEKTFTAGTTITATSGLKFVLDHDANIASGDAITRSTVTTTITAVDIGETYNLGPGTKFTLGSLSSSQYAAQSDQGTTGGSSHQATVVTKDDQSRLLATLSAELTEKAQTDLAAKLSNEQKLLPNAVTSNISKKKFSKDIGGEADVVSLDLTMDFEGIIFSQSDLVSVFVNNFSADIPSGFEMSPDKTVIDIKDIKTDKSGNATLKVHLNAVLLPKFDSKEVVNNISGKNLSAAKGFLLKIPGVSSVSIEAQPRMFQPIFKFFLPWKKENIKVDVVSE